MSNLPQQTTIVQYTADGVTAEFPFNFLILLATDISVYVRDADADPQPLVDIVSVDDYIVTGVGNLNGGIVEFDPDAIPASGSIVTLSRDMQISINTDFSDARNINGANLDAAFKRTVMIQQQLDTFINQRVPSYAIDSSDAPDENDVNLPILADGEIWQKSGDNIIGVSLDPSDGWATLTSQLASQVEGSAGTDHIGVYNPTTLSGQTLTDYIALNEAKAGYATDTGVSNAYAVTLSAIEAYAAGMNVSVKITNANTGASTLAINGLVIKSIKRCDGTALIANDLITGMIADFVYDGTYFQLQNPANLVAPAKSIGVNGYVALPGGLIMQWGTVNFSPSGVEYQFPVTWPLAFPNGILSATINAQTLADGSSPSGTGPMDIICFYNPTTTGADVRVDTNIDDALTGTHTANYLVIGY